MIAMTQITGTFYDILADSQGQALWESGWRSNIIVHNGDRLLAALMKGHAGLQGILYLAVGEGEEEWDSKLPPPDVSASQLSSEVLRLALGPDQIVYLENQKVPTTEITDCLEITADIKGEDLTPHGFQSLREFGLFGGDATDKPNSGFMIDYVIHPRIDLTPDATLTRRIRLSFRNSQAGTLTSVSRRAFRIARSAAIQ